MQIRAHLRYLRIAPRKVRLVIDLIRGLPVDRAIDQLSVLPKRSALPVLKLLNSALANAAHNYQLERKTLRIASIVANEGPKLKRWQPRAFGRAAPIIKRSTHITIVLEGASAKTKPIKAETPPNKIEASTIKGAPAMPPAAKAANKKSTKVEADQKHAGQDASVVRQGKD